jgi:hypothetical protein
MYTYNNNITKTNIQKDFKKTNAELDKLKSKLLEDKLLKRK